jgi:hypothetical protein
VAAPKTLLSPRWKGESMARLQQRIARLESQIKPAARASFTREESVFIGQCYDWIEAKMA